MVPLSALWLPILLSAVFVFVVSSIIHMFLPYHKSDFAELPAEAEVMDALRKFNIPPGEYAVPRAGSMKEMSSPEYIEKLNKGPVAFMTFMPNKQPSMTGSLIGWFVYSVIVSLLAAYIVSNLAGPEAGYRTIFRFISAAAFMGYALALWQNTIWYKRKLSTTLKSTFDSLIYALITGGTFGWLWPG